MAQYAQYNHKILEIGSGGGEQIAHLAVQNPASFCLAVEPFMNGVGKICQHIYNGKMPNIRVYPDSFWHIYPDIPDGFFDTICIFYPDPWRKARHYERRMITKTKIADISRILKTGGELQFATDDTILLQSVMVDMYMARNQFAWVNSGPNQFLHRPPQFIESRYETKAIEQGRVPVYLQYRNI